MATFFGLVFFIALFSTIGLLIKPSLTARGNNPALSRGKIAMFGLGASVLSFVMIGVFAPKVDPQLEVGQFSDDQIEVKEQDGSIVITPKEAELNSMDKKLETIKGYNKNILAVRSHSNNVLEIDLPATEVAFTDLAYIDHTSRTIRDILIKILKESPQEQFSAIRFVVFADLRDQYNNKKNEPIFQLTYDYPELKKININDDYVDHRVFMNFATFGLRNAVAHEMFEQWCLKDDNAERSGSFCQ